MEDIELMNRISRDVLSTRLIGSQDCNPVSKDHNIPGHANQLQDRHHTKRCHGASPSGHPILFADMTLQNRTEEERGEAQAKQTSCMLATIVLHWTTHLDVRCPAKTVSETNLVLSVDNNIIVFHLLCLFNLHVKISCKQLRTYDVVVYLPIYSVPCFVQIGGCRGEIAATRMMGWTCRGHCRA